jgi:exosome complex component CSL4
MTKKIGQSTQFVVPGEKLGVIEEFVPGPDTHEENGIIYSGTIGVARIDTINKTVDVQRKVKRPLIPEEGSTVTSTVINAQDKVAQVSIIEINQKQVGTPFSGILHISSSSPRYERTMKEVCKTGDVVRAKVVSTQNGVPQLTTIGRGLGVVKAYCSQCGHVLGLRNRLLQCPSCAGIERRKIAEDYGKDVV